MNNEKLTVRQENFIHYILQGYCLKDSYIKAFSKNDYAPSTLYVIASQTFHDPKIHNRFLELREKQYEEMREMAIWTKEQAIDELKELLRKNRVESDRYEQAYNDEIEMLDRQIEEKENELNNYKGYLSKKKKAELQDDIDSLKMARIQCNRRHQSNRNVNEAILNSIQQLNEMLGYNKKDDKKAEEQEQVIFTDDVPEDDEE